MASEPSTGLAGGVARLALDGSKTARDIHAFFVQKLGTGGSVAVGFLGSLSLAYGLKALLEKTLTGTQYRKLLFWRKPVRVWIDGCYDLTHFGHYNAFRQAKALGDVLIVGLNPDAEVIKHKGSPPLMTDEERYVTVSSCKWVDVVVRDVPYVLDVDYLNKVVFGQYQCDYVVHGDDPCLDCDGNDVFATSKAAGKYKEIKRTEGVSTTDLVGRMLLMTRDHHGRQLRSSESPTARKLQWAETRAGGFQAFLPTSRRIAEFSSSSSPAPHQRVVYVDGAFDLLLPGQCAFLQRARALGDFLVVGVHRDEVVNLYKGDNYPIMNLQERTLGVLSCRYVDEVVIGAPWEVSEDLIKTFNISVVAHGKVYDHTANGREDYDNAYRVPREKGIFVEVEHPITLSTPTLIQRIVDQRRAFEAKYAKKKAQEQRYYENKTYKVEG